MARKATAKKSTKASSARRSSRATKKKGPRTRKPSEKIFYKIGEVCGMTDTEPYVLRYWESEFPNLAPSKNRSGQRIYAQEDVDMVLRIKELLYEEGYTIAGARRKLEEEAARGKVKPTTATGSEREELESLRVQVRKIRTELRAILDLLS